MMADDDFSHQLFAVNRDSHGEDFRDLDFADNLPDSNREQWAPFEEANLEERVKDVCERMSTIGDYTTRKSLEITMDILERWMSNSPSFSANWLSGWGTRPSLLTGIDTSVWTWTLPKTLLHSIEKGEVKESCQLWSQLPSYIRSSSDNWQMPLLGRMLDKGDITAAQAIIRSNNPMRSAVETKDLELIAVLGKYKLFREQEYLLTLDGVANDKDLVEALENAGITAELGSEAYYMEMALQEKDPERLRFYVNRHRRLTGLNEFLLATVTAFKRFALHQDDARISTLGNHLGLLQVKKLGFQGFRKLTRGEELNKSIAQTISMILLAYSMYQLDSSELGGPDAFQTDLQTWRDHAVRPEDLDLFDIIAREVWGREFTENPEAEIPDLHQSSLLDLLVPQQEAWGREFIENPDAEIPDLNRSSPLKLLVQQLVNRTYDNITQPTDSSGRDRNFFSFNANLDVLLAPDGLATRSGVVSSNSAAPPPQQKPQIEKAAIPGDQTTEAGGLWSTATQSLVQSFIFIAIFLCLLMSLQTPHKTFKSEHSMSLFSRENASIISQEVIIPFKESGLINEEIAQRLQSKIDCGSIRTLKSIHHHLKTSKLLWPPTTKSFWHAVKTKANHKLELLRLRERCRIFAHSFGLAFPEDTLNKIDDGHLQISSPMAHGREEQALVEHLLHYNDAHGPAMDNGSSHESLHPNNTSPYLGYHPAELGSSDQTAASSSYPASPLEDPQPTATQAIVQGRSQTTSPRCLTCDKTYQSTSSLNKHKRKHDDSEALQEGKLVCRYCMNDYVKDHWKVHIQTCKQPSGRPNREKVKISRGMNFNCHYCGNPSVWGPVYDHHCKGCAEKKKCERAREDQRKRLKTSNQ